MMVRLDSPNSVPPGQIIIEWISQCCRPQATESLNAPIVWQDLLPGDPDVISVAPGRVVLRGSTPQRFFRTVYPQARPKSLQEHRWPEP
jgi:hypothetical protein